MPNNPDCLFGEISGFSYYLLILLLTTSRLPHSHTHLHKSTHVRHHDGIAIVVKLFQERHFGMNAHDGAGLRACRNLDLVQLVLGNGDVRATYRCVFLVKVHCPFAPRMRDEEIEGIC